MKRKMENITSPSSTSTSILPDNISQRVVICGSGASTSVPWLQCTIGNGCHICKNALPGTKNRRNNVSALYSVNNVKKRIPSEKIIPGTSNTDAHILIDCGKTFRQTIEYIFPKYGIRAIDGLLITHGHMDAIGGLDDLRDISPLSPLPVYMSESCYKTVSSMYPYLTPADKSSVPVIDNDYYDNLLKMNGKDNMTKNHESKGVKTVPGTYVAKLDFFIVKPYIPFEIRNTGGIIITPLPVEHGGECFAFELGSIAILPYDLGDFIINNSNSSRMMNKKKMIIDTNNSNSSNSNEDTMIIENTANSNTDNNTMNITNNNIITTTSTSSNQPNRVIYLSDVIAIPALTRQYLKNKPISLLAIDCLNSLPYPTHFSTAQTLACSLELGATSTRFIGMNHRIDYTLENEKLIDWCNNSDYIASINMKGMDMQFGYDGLSHDITGIDVVHRQDIVNEIQTIRDYITQCKENPHHHIDNNDNLMIEGQAKVWEDEPYNYASTLLPEWHDNRSPSVQQYLKNWHWLPENYNGERKPGEKERKTI